MFRESGWGGGWAVSAERQHNVVRWNALAVVHDALVATD